MQKIVNRNAFDIVQIISVGFGSLKVSHVALGQVYVIRGGFDIKFDGTSSLNSGFGIVGLPLGTENCRVCWR